MKKDFIVALSLGFAFGLGLAVMVLYAPKILSFRPDLSFLTKKNNSTSPTAAPSPSPVYKFEISSPKDQALISTDKVDIQGKADPASIVIISSPDTDTIAKVNRDGSFKESVPIDEGANIFFVSAYMDGQLQVKKELNLFMTAEKL